MLRLLSTTMGLLTTYKYLTLRTILTTDLATTVLTFVHTTLDPTRTTQPHMITKITTLPTMNLAATGSTCAHVQQTIIFKKGSQDINCSLIEVWCHWTAMTLAKMTSAMTTTMMVVIKLSLTGGEEEDREAAIPSASQDWVTACPVAQLGRGGGETSARGHARPTGPTAGSVLETLRPGGGATGSVLLAGPTAGCAIPTAGAFRSGPAPCWQAHIVDFTSRSTLCYNLGQEAILASVILARAPPEDAEVLPYIHLTHKVKRMSITENAIRKSLF